MKIANAFKEAFIAINYIVKKKISKKTFSYFKQNEKGRIRANQLFCPPDQNTSRTLMTVTGLISNNDETHYRKEIERIVN